MVTAERLEHDRYQRLSDEIVHLVQAYSAATPKTELSRHLAFWCQNCPLANVKQVHVALGLEPSNWIHEWQRVSASSAAAALAHAVLCERVLPVFMLRDCTPAVEWYRRLAPAQTAVEVIFGRQELGGRGLPQPYFQLASIVNRSALRARADWWAFVAEHSAEFWTLVRSTTVGRQIRDQISEALEHAWPALRDAIGEGKRIVVTDTGMQATFALPIAEFIRSRLALSMEVVDVQLLGTYTWLVDLLGPRAVNSDPEAVALVELEADNRWKGTVAAPTSL